MHSGVEDGRAPLLDRWAWLRVISVPDRLFPGKARNLGAAQARGELLAFLDADAVPSPNWLDHLERAVVGAVDAVAGAILNGTPESRVGTAEYLLGCSEAFPRRPRRRRHSLSGNLLVRTDYFHAAGGFPDGLRAGEDTVFTFPLASQQRLAFEPQATVTYLNRTALTPFLANQYLQGAAFVAVCRLVPYPHRWVCRGPALLLAGPLRLASLARWLFRNPDQGRQAIRAWPQLILGTAVWVAGAFGARRGPDHLASPPDARGSGVPVTARRQHHLHFDIP